MVALSRAFGTTVKNTAGRCYPGVWQTLGLMTCQLARKGSSAMNRHLYAVLMMDSWSPTIWTDPGMNQDRFKQPNTNDLTVTRQKLPRTSVSSLLQSHCPRSYHARLFAPFLFTAPLGRPDSLREHRRDVPTVSGSSTTVFIASIPFDPLAPLDLSFSLHHLFLLAVSPELPDCLHDQPLPSYHLTH